MSFDTPILFLTYKRFNTAKRVFNEIKKIKPKKLYFASNIPQRANIEEMKLVNRVRYLIEEINWECNVIKIFHKKHLPVSKSIPKSISTFFKFENEGIILEDDCLPSGDFFKFCQIMLKKYKNENINVICGSRFVKPRDNDIYFSKYNHAWGWATWKTSWKKFDPEIKFWKKFKKSTKWTSQSNLIEKKYWEKIFDLTFKKKINTWDYAWTACAWYNNQLSIIPPINLIKNIGFGPDATWTIKSKNSNFTKPKNLKSFNFKKQKVIQNINFDTKVFFKHFKGDRQNLIYRTKDNLKLLINDPKTFYLKIKRNLKNV